VPDELQRIIPSPQVAVDSIRDHYAPLASLSQGNRPSIAICMVSSLDGSIAVAGRSAGLSNPNDAAVLRTLREHADVVIVGAGTVRDESYGAPVRADQRVGVVTVSGDLDLSGPLFARHNGFLICPDDSEPPDGVDVLRVTRHGDGIDVSEAIDRLGEVVGQQVNHVLCEGGSRLNGALIEADLVDEVNLTMSPLLVGGTGPRLSSTGVEVTQRFELAQLIVDADSMMFGRWTRRRVDH
jgi:5-amino-6-(5-phosphoribosylamino)uracil reductase